MAKQASIRLEFADNGRLALLAGEHNQNLAKLEKALEVQLDSFGNAIDISGPAAATKKARLALEHIYRRLDDKEEPQRYGSLVRDALRWVEAGDSPPPGDQRIETWRRKISARTPGQGKYLKLLGACDVVFGLGPAGTGKTYLAVAKAVEAMKRRQVERIVLSRPAVEAGERLGFLPGDMKQKVDPYLRPLYDALHDMMPAEKVERMIASGEIEVAPIAFMRGRTLHSSYVIIDEAQNTTCVQMKMVLTRLGNDSRMVITGDLGQVDLPHGQPSGLADAVDRVKGIEGVGIMHLDGADVVRHPVVARILDAYK